jgi:hypothetical protein
MMNKGRGNILWFVVSSIMLFLFFLASGCNQHTEESITVAMPSPSFHSQFSIRDIWPQAMSVAQEWQADAYVTGVDSDIGLFSEATPDWTGRPEVRFFVQSPSEDYVTLTVSCNVLGCSSVETEREFSTIPLSPIMLDDFVLDISEVMAIAQQHSEVSLVNQDPQLSVGMGLSRIDSWVVWSVSYLDLSSLDRFIIRIDAITGEVIESQ